MGTTGRHDQAEGLSGFLSAPVVKRSVTVAGHSTSVSIEQPYWDELCAIAQRRGLSVNALIADIDAGRGTNLSSAIRLYVLATVKGGAGI